MVSFLKLGGSLITDKHQPSALRQNTLNRLAQEIRSAREEKPDLCLLIGHGSGSFGHIPAKKYNTKKGVFTPADWKGFSEVWLEARTLNQHVMEALSAQGLPAIAISPFSAVTAEQGKVKTWDTAIIRNCLNQGLIPVIYGDVIIDTNQGGTILSTEDLFLYLAEILHPDRILIAGIENGVYADFPQRSALIPEINRKNYNQYQKSITISENTDVTGGMASKVARIMEMIDKNPDGRALIFSGNEPGFLFQALVDDRKVQATHLYNQEE